MFKNLDEIKAFVLWCKDSGIKTMKYGELSFELNDTQYANVPDLSSNSAENKLASTESLIDTDKPSKDEEEELLYWSAQR